MHQTLATEPLNTLAHGGQAGAPGGEKGVLGIDKYIYLYLLTTTLK